MATGQRSEENYSKRQAVNADGDTRIQILIFKVDYTVLMLVFKLHGTATNLSQPVWFIALSEQPPIYASRLVKTFEKIYVNKIGLNIILYLLHN